MRFASKKSGALGRVERFIERDMRMPDESLKLRVGIWTGWAMGRVLDWVAGQEGSIQKSNMADWRKMEKQRHELADEIAQLETQVVRLRELQAELEPQALRLEPEVVMYKATPNLVPHAKALEKFLTIMRSIDA